VNWLFNKNLVGFEIGPKAVKMAVIDRSKTNWRLAHWGSIPLPDGTLKPAFKSPNVVKPEEFNDAVHRLLEGYQGKITAAGLSLPSEIIRIFIRSFPKVPDSRSDTEKLINWSLEKSFNFPVENTQVSFQPTGHDGTGNPNLLVTVGMKNVIQQFESILAGKSIDTRVVRPASLNL
jgi:Tfp pilus assembly PilM family ATPase